MAKNVDPKYQLSEEEFMTLAFRAYDNPHCVSVDEFEHDIKRIQSLSKLFYRFHVNDDLRERLILNHLIVFFNVFGPVVGKRLLFAKLPKYYYSYLKTFLLYLNYMSADEMTDIPLNSKMVEVLRKI